MKVYLDAVGLLAPGLAGWRGARAVLAGDASYREEPMPRPTADILPPAERRRCGDAVRLALHVGVEALETSGAPAATLPTVFTSSAGDGIVLHEICTALAAPERALSPTRFHNSVHNAAAGYWTIATGARVPSTSLCAYRGSFAAGLLEAALQSTTERRAVLLIGCDTVLPEPLHAACPVVAPFAVALVIAAERGAASAAALEIALERGSEPTRLVDPGLETLRCGNDIARCLPLLASIARQRSERVVLEYLPPQALAVAVAPCN
jgi:hypothetical protein